MGTKIQALSPETIETFRRDGVVQIRNAFDPAWLSTLQAGIERDLRQPTSRLVRHTPADADAHYWEDYWAWSEEPEFEDFLRHSPAASLAAQLYDTSRINLVMDNWFLREAGSAGRAPWHHDVSYFDFTGSMCVLWLPLQKASAEESISFIRGSHAWGKLFLRKFFKDHSSTQVAGEVNGVQYHEVPDIDGHPEDFDILKFDFDLGDCVLFDIRTLHGSLKSVIPQRAISRFTVRFATDDARITYRGEWAAAERAIFEAAGHREGDALDSDFFPRLWVASEH